ARELPRPGGGGAGMTETPYVFEGTHHEAKLDRLRTLEAAPHPGTRACLLPTGLREVWRCLEVGAGAGSVARSAYPRLPRRLRVDLLQGRGGAGADFRVAAP